MREALELRGVVLKAQPIREYDKRLVILTAERGRITAFARGARRPTSPLLAAANPFVFGYFSLFEGKDAYSLVQVRPTDFFEDLPRHLPGVYYGFYFLELASFFIQEEEEASGTVDLIYVALKAILREQIPLPLIRRIFELKILTLNGLFAPPEKSEGLNESAFYALNYCADSPAMKLFSFTLSDEAMRDFEAFVKKQMDRSADRPFKSLELIDGGF